MPTAEVHRAVPGPGVLYAVRDLGDHLLLTDLEVNIKDHWEDARLAFHQNHWDPLVVQPGDGLVQALQVLLSVEDQHPRLREVGASLEAGVREPVALGAVVRAEPLQRPLELHELRGGAELAAEAPVPLLQLFQPPPGHRLLALGPRCLHRCRLGLALGARRLRRLARRLGLTLRLRALGAAVVGGIRGAGHAEDRAAEVDHVLEAGVLRQLWAQALAVGRDVQALDLEAPVGHPPANQQRHRPLWPAICRQPCKGCVAVPRRETDGPVEDDEGAVTSAYGHLETV
mmetsp:Transcript_48170/g.139570  ORF Transcript_48170/g.139570 Transcript_48170/m.139570 type:complete len:286 (+) Transcript_48170:1857-2714(+)